MTQKVVAQTFRTHEELEKVFSMCAPGVAPSPAFGGEGEGVSMAGGLRPAAKFPPKSTPTGGTGRRIDTTCIKSGFLGLKTADLRIPLRIPGMTSETPIYAKTHKKD